MSKGKKYILFLNNRYSRKENDYYLRLIRGRTTFAVDGGIRFFIKNKIMPDLLIGDFDSAPRLSKKYLSRIEVIGHPEKKDKTDSQLALELAMERGAADIAIVGAVGSTEIDHTLGNIFLLQLVNDYQKKTGRRINSTIITPNSNVWLIENDRLRFSGNKGDLVSVLPLSNEVKIDFEGLEYPPPKRALALGDSLTLRNRMKGKRCWIKAKGRVIVVRAGIGSC